MIPENQAWQKAEDIVYLVKNHGSGDGGYYVDVRGSHEVMDVVKKKLDGFNKVNCQWSPFGTGAEKVLTVRSRKRDTRACREGTRQPWLFAN